MKKKDIQYNGHCNYLPINVRSTHAEEMAIDKLKPNKKRKLIKVSILVIRINPVSPLESYTLLNSRPCANCISRISKARKYGYKISDVYFSNSNGEIVHYKLRNLLKEKQYLSRYYRTCNLPNELRKNLSIEANQNSQYDNDARKKSLRKSK